MSRKFNFDLKIGSDLVLMMIILSLKMFEQMDNVNKEILRFYFQFFIDCKQNFRKVETHNSCAGFVFNITKIFVDVGLIRNTVGRHPLIPLVTGYSSLGSYPIDVLIFCQIYKYPLVFYKKKYFCYN